MEYFGKVTREGKNWLVEFPDCPGCQTFGGTEEEAREAAAEALEGWLETHLVGGLEAPRPKARSGMAVAVPAALGLKLQLRWARADAGLTQAQLAKRLGVTQQMIAKLEHPDYEPSLSKAELVAKALGLNLAASLVVPRLKRAPDLMMALTAHLAGKKQKAARAASHR